MGSRDSPEVVVRQSDYSGRRKRTMGPAGDKPLPPHVTRLLEQLKAEDAYYRQTAVEELSSEGLRDDRIRVALEAVEASDPDRNVRAAALEALVRLEFRTAPPSGVGMRTSAPASVLKPLPPKIARLLAQLQSPDAYKRQTAAEEFSSLGFRDERVRVALEQAETSDPEKNVRSAALEALVMLDYRRIKGRR